MLMPKPCSGDFKLLVLQKIESPGLDGRCWDYAEKVGTA